MSERDEALAAIRVAAGGIDPVIDQAQDYAKGVIAIQKIVRQQGQVLSLALQNNHTLYHTNKDLVQAKRELEAVEQGLNQQIRTLQGQISALQEHVHKLEEAGGDKWKPLYLDARKTIEAWLFGEHDVDSLAAQLEALKGQQKELEETPETLSQLEILRKDNPDVKADDPELRRPGSPYYVPPR